MITTDTIILTRGLSMQPLTNPKHTPVKKIDYFRRMDTSDSEDSSGRESNDLKEYFVIREKGGKDTEDQTIFVPNSKK
jgi:hypothetical protein